MSEETRGSRGYGSSCQRTTLLDAIDEQVTHDPRLRPHNLSAWEMRFGVHRVFYDTDEQERKVTIKAVGRKEHNQLFIRGKEYQL